MGSSSIAVGTPRVKLLLRIFQTDKPMLVQTYLPETRVETLDVSMIGWFSGAAQIPLHFVEVSPPIQRFRNERGPLSTRIAIGLPRPCVTASKTFTACETLTCPNPQTLTTQVIH